MSLHYWARALKIAAHRLGTLRLPVNLDHGGLCAGQIVAGATNPAFIDWSDTSLTHPFFSMAFFSDKEEMHPYLGDAPDTPEQLRDEYLEPWTVYEPHDILTQAWSIACSLASLAPLSTALPYHDHILPGMEVKWEMGNTIPLFLRDVLRHQGEALPTSARSWAWGSSTDHTSYGVGGMAGALLPFVRAVEAYMFCAVSVA